MDLLIRDHQHIGANDSYQVRGRVDDCFEAVHLIILITARILDLSYFHRLFLLDPQNLHRVVPKRDSPYVEIV